MFSSKDLFFAPTATTGYRIEKSLRFRSSASAYLSRTPTSTGNQQKWTFSCWVKSSKSAATQVLYTAYSSTTNYGIISFSSSGFLGNTDTFKFVNTVANAAVLNIETSAVYRDPSAWYHVVVAIDTTQATTTNRVAIYINGQQITALATSTYPAQNATVGFFNSSSYAQQIGALASGTYGYLDGYLADVNFIDGQQLAASSFGANDATTGVWGPKAYTGSYTGNSFYLKFNDNSSTTNLCLDRSGLGNNWTPNNISVTAGATYDSMIDTPTPYDDGGNGVGNYATLNPLNISQSGAPTFSNANLYVSEANATLEGVTTSTIGVTSGKWYLEFTCNATGTNTSFNGVAISYGASSVAPRTAGIIYSPNGQKRVNNTQTAYGSTWTTNDVIGIAIDADANQVTFYKNNVSQGAISFTPTSQIFYCFYATNEASGMSGWHNFGQRPFTYTPPSGFKALNTQNLPTPTIAAGNKYFDALLYTGTGSNPRTLTGLAFQPDFVWLKNRTSGWGHRLSNAVIGANYALETNNTSAELYQNQYGYLTSFNADGFSVTGGSTDDYFTNDLNNAYVGWSWKAGNGTTNIAVNAYGSTPSIASTVSANATAGFSVVTYQIPTSGTSFTIGHGLGVAPSMIIQKARSTTSNWQVYHSSLGATNGIWLNLTNASGAQTWWNNTAPTSTLFSINNSLQGASAVDTVAYCFAAVAGYSAFGSYTGNGSADGPFVFTGMRPRYVIIKGSSTAGTGWYIYDTARNTYNVLDLYLRPEVSDAEGTLATMDTLSNGFKLRSSNSQFNGSGTTYIYAAFAENPFKYALAR